jgi:hypothetical protein
MKTTALAVVALSVASCRGGGALAIDAGGSPGIDAGGSPCPTLRPDAGDICTFEGQTCSYGEGTQLACRSVATCHDSHFGLSPGSSGPCLDPTPTCPTGSLDGGVCDRGAGYCALADGTHCFCQPCPPGGGLWSCRQPAPSGMKWWVCVLPPPPPCPPTVPNSGQPCSMPAKCFYLSTCARCDGHQWSWYDAVGDSYPGCL